MHFFDFVIIALVRRLEYRSDQSYGLLSLFQNADILGPGAFRLYFCNDLHDRGKFMIMRVDKLIFIIFFKQCARHTFMLLGTAKVMSTKTLQLHRILTRSLVVQVIFVDE